MSKQKEQIELAPPIWAPPIDEARREALRRDPRVVHYRNPDPHHKWSFEPTLWVETPFDFNELMDLFDENDEVEVEVCR